MMILEGGIFFEIYGGGVYQVYSENSINKIAQED